MFEYQGARADKHVREHEVYMVGSPGKDIKLWLGGRKVKVRSETAAQGTDSNAEAADAETVIKPKMGSAKKILYAGVSLAVAVVLAFALRGGKSEPEPSPPQVAAVAKSAKPAVAPAPTAAPGGGPFANAPEVKAEAGKTASAPKNGTAKLAEAAPSAAALPASQTGSIALAISPWGEIYIDGRKMGVSPPLKELQVTPGKHTIEIKNTSFASHTETLEVKLNDRLNIKHEFR